VRAALVSSVSCLLAPFTAAQIDGLVMNGTTGMPQPQVSVSLVQPGAKGMQALATASSDAQGKFRIARPAPDGPALLQGVYKEVTYTLILQPGAPATGLRLAVYDTTTRLASARMTQHVYVFEPGDEDLHVSETFLLENNTDATFQDPVKGSVQIHVPGEPKDLGASVEGTAGMSIRRQLEKAGQPGVYKLAYPIKPGESRIDITYRIPLAEKYSWRILRTDGPTRIATPSGVTMTGSSLKDLGIEPRSQAHLYEVADRAASFDAVIQGSGSLRRASAEGESKEDDGSPKPEVIPPRIYTRLSWVLGLAFGILALGGALVYRRGRA
jgi:hypothetical protein